MSTSTLKAEPVATNHFFKLLRDQYQDLYKLVSQNGWRVCVPHSSSIGDTPLTEQFLKSHIMQNSPFFKDEFITSNRQKVTIREGVVSTKSGFETPSTAKILSEELFYTNDSKFVVYCISNPLVVIAGSDDLKSRPSSSGSGGSGGPDTGGNNNGGAQSRSLFFGVSRGAMSETGPRMYQWKSKETTAVEYRSVEQWKQVLKTELSQHEYQQMRVWLDDFVTTFTKSHVMFKGYTSWTSQKIKEYRDKAVQSKLLNIPKFRNHLTYAQQNELSMAFDCLLHSRVYSFIFQQLIIHMKTEDELLSRKIRAIQQEHLLSPQSN
ncbi:hypothetical protein RFI_20526, partial [Reticulomyxa filosa]